MTVLSTAAPGCELHGERAVGFSGTLRPGQSAEVLVEFSCGCRTQTAAPVSVGPFQTAGDITCSGWEPATGMVRRGPLSPVPVYYATRSESAGDAVVFSTRLDDLLDRSTGAPPVLDTAAAALLAGGDVPPPLTVYQGVSRLALGTGVSVAGRRQRLHHEAFDPAALEPTKRKAGRQTPVVAEMLAEALTDTPSGPVGTSGGVASAVLGHLATRPAVHAHIGLPVLGLRRKRLDPGVDVVDGTGAWWQICEDAAVPYPEELDVWDTAVAVGSSTTPVSGFGLALLFTGMPGNPQRWRSGWRLLGAAEPPPELHDNPWWRAWRRPAPAANGDQRGSEPMTSPQHAWLTQQALAAGATASTARISSHLVADQDPVVSTVLQRVLQVLDDPSECWGSSAGTSTLLAAHPAVVGAAIAAARSPQRERGHAQIFPTVLGDLLPATWRPADPPTPARMQLLAAAYIQHRLGSAKQRADLLNWLEGTSWVERAPLEEVLADHRETLRAGVPLLRLYATLARFPQAFEEA